MAGKFTEVLDTKGRKVSHLFRMEGSPHIYVRKTFKRYRIKPLFQSTGESSITKAQARAQELITEHFNHFIGNKTGLKETRFAYRSIGSVIDEINQTETPNLRKRTQEHRHLYFRELKKELGDLDITRLDLKRWASWLEKFKARKARKTYWDYAKHMNIIVRYAYQEKYITHLLKFKNPDTEGPKEGRVYTQHELSRLYEEMNDTTRDQFILSYENYMRLREVLYLRWDRINLADGMVRLKAADVKTGSKTKKGREFFLSPAAHQRLLARKKLIGNSSPWVFPSPDDLSKPVTQNITAWKAAKRRAGIKGVATWHSLRHTAITHALNADPAVRPSIDQVSEFAGVTVATLQKIYLHSTAANTRQASQVLKIITPRGCDNGVTRGKL